MKWRRPSALAWFRRPRHCQTCGDEFVTSTYRDGYRSSDGSPIERTWSHCPRNDDTRPPWFASGFHHRGDCYGLSPMSCVNEMAAYRAHRPERTGCRHHTVSDSGENCWAKDGTPITVDRRPVA